VRTLAVPCLLLLFNRPSIKYYFFCLDKLLYLSIAVVSPFFGPFPPTPLFSPSTVFTDRQRPISFFGYAAPPPFRSVACGQLLEKRREKERERERGGGKRSKRKMGKRTRDGGGREKSFAYFI